MGLFSAKSTSTTQNDIDETSAQNVDNRVSDGDNAFFDGNISLTAGQNIGNVNVTKTDYGAIDSAASIVNQSLSALSKGFESVNKTAQNAVNSANQTAGGALDIASESTRDEGARTMQIGLTLAGVVALVFIFKK